MHHEQYGEPHTDLNKGILAEIGAVDGDDIVEWLYRDFSPARVAALMRLISSSALQGDNQAEKIIRRAARRLAIRSVGPVARELRMDEGDLHIYTAGGIWEASPLYAEAFIRAIAGPNAFWNPPPAQLIMHKPAHDPAYGAALLALNSPAERP
jgi:N-acetylglucosamine kinase-like BadF-type ATPase